MHSRIYRPLVTAVVLAALTAIPASAELPKTPAAHSAEVHLTVKPGQTVRWRSPRIGPVDRLHLTLAGRSAVYAVEAHTHNCVAYAYEAGVAVRLTDCVKGHRVPYVRLRAMSVALKPVRLALWLN